MTIKVNGKLLFDCVNVKTVDELGLPKPNSHLDGLTRFTLKSYCCDTMKEFDTYDNYTKINMTLHPYPNLLGTMYEPTLILDIEYDSLLNFHEKRIPIRVCPWCQTKPTLNIAKQIKRIEECKTIVIPSKREQICTVREEEEI